MYGRGLICLTLTKERSNRMGLAPMVQEQQCSIHDELYGFSPMKLPRA
ncbi:hypothetical protein O9929_08690 [Vibrio lentus]|nr:hypothetical protein [Vibrio lentus]